VSAPHLVPCPTCGKPTAYAASNRWRPFCCERCRSIDLGAWASEAYRIPDPASDPASGEQAADPGRPVDPENGS
jgi:endogenous inhibitor of DNA gyrase (YacG/DUF329 family)